jgi:neutral ceramidase
VGGGEGATCAAIHDLWSAFTCTTTTTPCQAEKPIVLEMGSMKPFPWSPEVLPLQLVTVGNVALVAVPFELTTMAGRRLRETVRAHLGPAGVTEVVIAGLANAYAGYVTTREEYAKQDYEGASTHFGPWTLAALQQNFARVAEAMSQGRSLPPGPEPRDMSGKVNNARLPVRPDELPEGERFGSVLENAQGPYSRNQQVRVKFWGANPRNDLRTQGSFLEVQRRDESGAWKPIAYDWDWETVLRWARYPCPQGRACSLVTIEWKIPADATPGTYRIQHAGKWRDARGQLHDYEGLSREFLVRE